MGAHAEPVLRPLQVADLVDNSGKETGNRRESERTEGEEGKKREVREKGVGRQREKGREGKRGGGGANRETDRVH